MPVSQHKVKRLVELADSAIAAAEREKSKALACEASWLVEDCDRAINNFHSIKERAISGSLAISNGAGLGISRALSEWNVSDEFYSAGWDLEDYYRNEYRA